MNFIGATFRMNKKRILTANADDLMYIALEQGLTPHMRKVTLRFAEAFIL